MAAIPECQANDNVALDRCAIVVDPAQTSFVQYAVGELSGYLEHATGRDVPVAHTDESGASTRIAVGPETAQRILGTLFPAEKLGKDGYLLKSVSQDGVLWIVAAGATPHGTKNAVSALIKTIRIVGDSASIPSALDRLGKPAYAIRGVHFNGWPLNYPYSFRSWREEDWQCYLDLLSYQGVNLFYLWPFVEIMPVPFSAEDQAYLEECRRLIDYAQTKHGMEVWIMQCTNRVAKDRCGIADPRLRPYWRPESQRDLDPGQPDDFRAILASREAMYRILDNADGVCNIDSDPGFCPGSSQDDYVKVLRACRELLDRHNIHGQEAKLINWMLWGWGREQKIEIQGLAEHQRDALRHLKQGLPDSLWLISGQFPEFLPICREAGFAERTVLMPYGTIEFEPAYPQTNVQIGAIRDMYNGPDAQSTDVAGLMGNMQTPLLQFPNMFFFTSVLADADYRNRSEREVLEELAGYIYPEPPRTTGRRLVGTEGNRSRAGGYRCRSGRMHDPSEFLRKVGALLPQGVSRPSVRSRVASPSASAACGSGTSRARRDVLRTAVRIREAAGGTRQRLSCMGHRARLARPVGLEHLASRQLPVRPSLWGDRRRTGQEPGG